MTVPEVNVSKLQQTTDGITDAQFVEAQVQV